jgi:large subunit ribosomal protein L25
MSEERYSMVAEPRTVVGKQVKQLRRDGWIPAVIYSTKQEPLNIQLENLSLFKTLRKASTTHLIDLTVDGKKHTVLAREIQQHITRGDLLHVDFLEVDMKALISSEAELVGVGESAPEKQNLGVVTLALHSLPIECLPDDLISQIEVDFSKIQSPDDTITVADLKIPAGVTVTVDPETIVATFSYERAAVEGDEGFEVSAEAVEVIGKGKKDDDFDD